MRGWLTRDHRSLLTLLCACATVASAFVIFAATDRITGAATAMVDQAEKLRNRSLDVTQIETTWESAGHLTHKIITTKRDDETSAQFIARHQADVDAAKTVWPPV